MAVGSGSAAAKRARRFGAGARILGLAHQEEVGLARRHEPISRSGEPARANRLYQSWRHQDDQLRLLSLITGRPEECPQDRHIAEPRYGADLVREVVLQKSGNREALAVAKLNRGRCTTRRQSRDAE